MAGNYTSAKQCLVLNTSNLLWIFLRPWFVGNASRYMVRFSLPHPSASWIWGPELSREGPTNSLIGLQRSELCGTHCRIAQKSWPANRRWKSLEKVLETNWEQTEQTEQTFVLHGLQFKVKTVKTFKGVLLRHCFSQTLMKRWHVQSIAVAQTCNVLGWQVAFLHGPKIEAVAWMSSQPNSLQISR